MKNRNIVFLSVFSLILLLGFLSIFMEKEGASTIENRRLALFPHPTIKAFVNTEYQNKFSDTLADQFLFSQVTKKQMNKLVNFVDYKKVNKKFCENKYIHINDEIGTYNCDHRLLRLPRYYSKETEDNYKKVITKMNNEIKVLKYYYFINDSSNFDFTTNKEIYHFSEYFNENYRIFDFMDYNDYSKYFYKTDHHWNYNGYYRGYKEIIGMIYPNDELLSPEELVDFHLKYKGSLARTSKVYDFYDDFKAYKFNYKNHLEYINSKELDYGQYDMYFNNKINHDEFMDHYRELYGADFGEIIYDYKNDKENLLMIVNSYSNPINGLIASHFNKTYIIDLRYNKDFNYQRYITEHDINKVLITGNISLFDDESTHMFGGR